MGPGGESPAPEAGRPGQGRLLRRVGTVIFLCIVVFFAYNLAPLIMDSLEVGAGFDGLRKGLGFELEIVPSGAETCVIRFVMPCLLKHCQCLMLDSSIAHCALRNWRGKLH